MAENQNPVPNINEMINEIINEYAHGEEEVYLEPQTETVANAEPEAQPEVEDPAKEERAAKKQRTVRHTEENEIEGVKDFISIETQALWNNQMADKGFINEMEFGKLISPFCRNNRKEGLGILLCAQGAWFLCSGKGVLCKYGRDEGGLSIRSRRMGSFRTSEN